MRLETETSKKDGKDIKWQKYQKGKCHRKQNSDMKMTKTSNGKNVKKANAIGNRTAT